MKINRLLTAIVLVLLFHLPILVYQWDVGSFLKLGFVSLMCFVLPGNVILLRLGAGPRVSLLLGLPVGLAVTSFVLFATGAYLPTAVTLGSIALLSAIGGYAYWSPCRSWLLHRHMAGSLFFWGAAIAFAAVNFVGARDGTFLEDGSFYYLSPDSAFFIGIAHQLIDKTRAHTPNFTLQPLDYHTLYYYLIGRISVVVSVDVQDVWGRWGRGLLLLASFSGFYLLARLLTRNARIAAATLLGIIVWGGAVEGIYAIAYNTFPLMNGQWPPHYASSIGYTHLHYLIYISGATVSNLLLMTVVSLTYLSVRRPALLTCAVAIVPAAILSHLPGGFLVAGQIIATIGFILVRRRTADMARRIGFYALLGVAFGIFVLIVHPMDTAAPSGRSFLADDPVRRFWTNIIPVFVSGYTIKTVFFAGATILAAFSLSIRRRFGGVLFILPLLTLSILSFCFIGHTTNMSFYFLLPIPILILCGVGVFASMIRRRRPLFRLAIATALPFVLLGFAGVLTNLLVVQRAMAIVIESGVARSLFDIRDEVTQKDIIMTDLYSIGLRKENSFVVSAITGARVLTEGSAYGAELSPLFNKVRSDNDRFYAGVSADDARAIMDEYGVTGVMIPETWPLISALGAFGFREVPIGGSYRFFRIDRAAPQGNNGHARP